VPLGQDIKRLIYLHIHRTGGTTLRLEILYKCVDPRKIFFLQCDDPPAQCGTVDELLAMPRAKQEKLELIVGHMPFGLREQLPWPESWRYATFMREPIARTVSTYYQVRDSAVPQEGEEWMGPVAYADANRYTLEDYVRNRCMMGWNGMCQFLSNERFGKSFESDGDMFLEAWRNAKELAYVGFVEDYEESVRRLCEMFGWRMPANYAPRHALTPKDRTLSQSELEILTAANTYDQVLFDHFRQRFALGKRASAKSPALLIGRMAQALRWS
jgi:hypothetical protein